MRIGLWKTLMLIKYFLKMQEKCQGNPRQFIHLIVTSPPYFNIKDYSKDGLSKKSNI